MERKGRFFKNALLSVEDELAGVDLDNFKAYFGKTLPGEKILGELNDLEKRMMAWVFTRKEIMDSVYESNKHLLLEPAMFALYENECEIIMAKTEFIHLKFLDSLARRFGEGIRFGIRGYFMVVNSNDAGDLFEKESLKLVKAMQGVGSDSIN